MDIGTMIDAILSVRTITGYRYNVWAALECRLMYSVPLRALYNMTDEDKQNLQYAFDEVERHSRAYYNDVFGNLVDMHGSSQLAFSFFMHRIFGPPLPTRFSILGHGFPSQPAGPADKHIRRFAWPKNPYVWLRAVTMPISYSCRMGIPMYDSVTSMLWTCYDTGGFVLPFFGRRMSEKDVTVYANMLAAIPYDTVVLYRYAPVHSLLALFSMYDFVCFSEEPYMIGDTRMKPVFPATLIPIDFNRTLTMDEFYVGISPWSKGLYLKGYKDSIFTVMGMAADVLPGSSRKKKGVSYIHLFLPDTDKNFVFSADASLWDFV